MTNDNAEQSVETLTNEELIERLARAEAKIVDLKKSSQEQNSWEVNKEEAEENKWLSKEDIEALIKEAIKTQAIERQEEQYRQNQAETNNSSIWWEDPVTTTWFKAKSLSEYSKLTPQAQRAYMQESRDKAWEVLFADD